MADNVRSVPTNVNSESSHSESANASFLGTTGGYPFEDLCTSGGRLRRPDTRTTPRTLSLRRGQIGKKDDPGVVPGFLRSDGTRGPLLSGRRAEPAAVHRWTVNGSAINGPSGEATAARGFPSEARAVSTHVSVHLGIPGPCGESNPKCDHTFSAVSLLYRDRRSE